MRTEERKEAIVLIVVFESIRDGHFRISNLPNPNPGNFGSESGNFIGLLSSKVFLAMIGTAWSQVRITLRDAL